MTKTKGHIKSADRWKEKVMFNHQERTLCDKCKYPAGFCKHQMEDNYNDCCVDTPLSQEDVWQLVRTHAICATEKRNIWMNTSREIEQQKDRIYDLEKENQELTAFKKQMESILYKTIQGNIKGKEAKE